MRRIASISFLSVLIPFLLQLFPLAFVHVEIADAATPTVLSLPTARTMLGAGSVGDTIYVIGGISESGREVPTVQAYDTLNNRWSNKAFLNDARFGLASVSFNGKIYVVGGERFSGYPMVYSVEEYDPTTDIWSYKSIMLTERVELTAAVAHGKIYTIGGILWSPWVSMGALDEYDPINNTWATRSPMPTPRLGPASAVINDKIFVVGGLGVPPSSLLLAVLEVYDPVSDTWTTSVSMRTPRTDLAAAAVNNRLYAIGGWDPQSQKAFNTVEEFDPATNSWTTKSPMPTARSGLAVSVINGKIYAIGGKDGSKVLNAVEVYDPATDTWLPYADLSVSGTANANPVKSGSTAAYSITLENMGSGPVAGAAVTDLLPPEVVFQSCSVACTQSGNIVTAQVGPIGPGASVRFNITFTAPTVSTSTVITNRVMVSADEDATPENNFAVDALTVNPASGLVGPIPGNNVGNHVDIPMLVSPSALAFTEGGARVLVSDVNRLKIVDVFTGQVQIVPITGLSNIRRIVAEGQGPTALIANGGELVRVNFVTGTKTLIASGFNDLRGIAIEDSRHALVSDATGIFRITLSTGDVSRLIYSLATGDIAIEPGRGSAIFIPIGYDDLKRIDLQTNEVTSIGHSNVIFRGDALEVSPDGTFALANAGYGDTGIVRIDLRSGVGTVILDSGFCGYGSCRIADLALKPDGWEVISIWNSPWGNSLQTLNLFSQASKTAAYVGLGAIALAGDGSKILTTDSAPFSSLLQIDIVSGFSEHISRSGVGNLDLVLLPSGDQVLLTTGPWFSDPGNIIRIDLYTGREYLVKDNIAAKGLAAEAGGTSALFTTGDALNRLNLNTGDIQPIVQGLSGTFGVSLESSGQTALLVSSQGLLAVDLSTGAMRTVATVNGWGSYIAVEPGDKSALINLNGLSRIDLVNGTIIPLARGISSSGKMVIEAGAETALLATPEGIKRVRIRAAALPPPPITSVSPISGIQGQTITNFTVTGNNFQPNAILSFSGSGITVDSYSSVTAGQIIASISIGGNASVGARDVSVTNPDSQSATLTAAFQVQEAQPAITVSPTQITFPATPLNATSSPEMVMIMNQGTATLSLSSITTQVPFGLQGVLPTSVPAGGQASFEVTFTPNGPGPFSGNLTITGNAPTCPTVIPLQGTVKNSPPKITSVTATPAEVFKGDTSALSVSANDPDADTLTYLWTLSGCGALISDNAAQVSFSSAGVSSPCQAALTVTVGDGKGGTDSKSVSVKVINSPPVVNLTANPTEVFLGGMSKLTSAASDPDGDTLSYRWSVGSCGTIVPESKAPDTATFTAAAAVGPCAISLKVDDGKGGMATASTYVNVMGVEFEGFLTDSSFSPIGGNSMDVIFTRDNNTVCSNLSGKQLPAQKIPATNPGDQYLILQATRVDSSIGSVAFSLNMPQGYDSFGLSVLPAFLLKGAMPVQAFDAFPPPIGNSLNSTINNYQLSLCNDMSGFDCRGTPGLFPATPGSLKPLSTNYTRAGKLQLTVPFPPTNVVVVAIHLDYALRILAEGCWPAGSDSSFVQGSTFKAEVTTNASTSPGSLAVDLLAAGKNATGIAGFAQTSDTTSTPKMGVTVDISPSFPVPQPPGFSPTTNLSGFYAVALIPGVDYSIRLKNSSGENVPARSSNSTSIRLNPGEFRDLNFTSISLADPVIHGWIVDGEKGVPGTTVELIHPSSRKTIAISTTDAGGYYRFAFHQAGSFTVTITPPSGYIGTDTSQTVTVEPFQTLLVNFRVGKIH